MLINEILIVFVVAISAWWLVRAISHLRDQDSGRDAKLDVEAAAVLLAFSSAGVVLSFNLAIQIFGAVALVAGLGAGWALVRRSR
jgi:hypothetical protein